MDRYLIIVNTIFLLGFLYIVFNGIGPGLISHLIFGQKTCGGLRKGEICLIRDRSSSNGLSTCQATVKAHDRIGKKLYLEYTNSRGETKDEIFTYAEDNYGNCKSSELCDFELFNN